MARFKLPASRLAALTPRQVRAASDRDLYDFALRYAQAHALAPTGVRGAGAAAGPDTFNRAVRLELGRQSTPSAALARRKALALSLANRTTEASRRRALARLTAGYGITV